MRKFSIIVACDEKNGIGINNQLPWRIPSELKHFKQLTTTTTNDQLRHAVVMGRKTWESLPAQVRPLPGRLNVVLSRQQLTLPDGVIQAHSLDEALTLLNQANIEKVFVIGGANVYEQALHHPQCELIYLTRVYGQFTCDAFLPAIPSSFKEHPISEVLQEHDFKFQYFLLKKS